MTIETTLNDRGNNYGDYSENCNTTNALMDVIKHQAKLLPAIHKETIHMIFHKISRMVNGNHWYADNAHDIAGYATLLEKHINMRNGD